MKNTILLLFCISLLASNNLFSQWYRGSELSYRSISGNTYEVTLTVYSYCHIPPSDSISLSFYCVSPPYYFINKYFKKVPGSINDISLPCAAIQTTCSDPLSLNEGYRESIYRDTIVLSPCSSIRISYSTCCRGPNNTTQSPTSQNAYNEAFLNTLDAPGSSSPVFINSPVSRICTGQNVYINVGAVDPDGDSLSYELTPPLHNNSTPLVYLTGYSYLHPITSQPPFSCDPVSGLIRINPQNDLLTPMAIMVKKWRTINGTPTLIGTVTRDILISSSTCANTLPVLSGMDTTLTAGYNFNDTMFSKEICLGTLVNFNIWGFDADTLNPSIPGHPERFNITWDNGIPNGTFTVYQNNTSSAYANFNWIPVHNDVSMIPKCFTATIRDLACPYNGIQSFRYCLTVRGMYVNIGNDTLICSGETLTVTANADPSTKNYIWKVNGILQGPPFSVDTFVFNTAYYPAGLYSISVETNDGGVTISCPGVHIINVTVVPRPAINLGNDTVLCQGNSITLDAGPGQMYFWNTGAMTQTITLSTPTSQTYWVWVDGGNMTRCTNTDSIFVKIVPMPQFNLGPDTCVTSPIKIGFSGLGSQYNWLFNWSNGSLDDSILVSQSGTYTLTVTADRSTNCFLDKSQVVNVIDMQQWAVVNSNLTINPEKPIPVFGPSPPAGHFYNYNWFVNNSLVGTDSAYLPLYLPEGSYDLSLDAGGGCKGSINFKMLRLGIKVFPNPAQYRLNIILPYGESCSFELFDISGKSLFLRQELSGPVVLNTEFIASGLYFFKITNDKGEMLESGKIELLR